MANMSLIPVSDIAEKRKRGGIGITAITRLKHADLWEAAKKFNKGRYGGQSALAAKLNISPVEMGEWINLRACPPAAPTKKWPVKRLEQLEKDLLEITGKLLDDLFPNELRQNIHFLSAPKTYERTEIVQKEALEQYAIATRERLKIEQEPDRIIFDDETRTKLNDLLTKCLTALNPREKLILELRFGLTGEEPKTYYEIGQIICAKPHGGCGGGGLPLSRERVRQIEAKALRKIYESAHGDDLQRFLHKENAVVTPKRGPTQKFGAITSKPDAKTFAHKKSKRVKKPIVLHRRNMTNPPDVLTFDEFAKRYCERQDSTREQLLNTLQSHRQRFNPTGWMLLECQVLDSSRLGSYTILPYGPHNTFKEPLTRPVSPRGLASDISVVVALLLNNDDLSL